MKISKNSKFVFLILIYSFSLCVFDMLGIVNLTATARDEHEPLEGWFNTDRDTFISEQLNNSNYGSAGYLKIGDSISSKDITYLHFSLSSYDTSSAKNADLIIYVTHITQAMLLEVHIADSDAWNESSISWNNAPTYGNSIAQKSVSSTGFVTVDVSSALIDSQISEITFVIISETLSSTQIRSKENMDTSWEDEFPHLVLIKNPYTVPGFDIFLTIFLISIVIPSVCIKLKINRKLKVVS